MSPRRSPAPAQWLADEGVEKIFGKTLRAHGTRAHDLEDARQDVYVKVLVALRRGVAPADLEQMKALCVTIARRHAVSALRQAVVRSRDRVAECEPDELAPLTRSVQQRDPVDASRQLEALAQLFRESRMPPDGVDILEGVACGCSWAAIASPLGISEDLAETRYRRMRAVYRRRLSKLGLLPDPIALRLVLSKPGAIARLRAAA